MTRGDQIRAMSDEQLAAFIANFLRTRRITVIRELQAKGLLPPICIIDVPMVDEALHLKLLKETVPEEKEDG